MRWLIRFNKCLILIIFLTLSISTSDVQLGKVADRVYFLAVDQAFNFGSWTVSGAWLKISQSVLATPRYFTPGTQHQLVSEYLELVRSQEKTEREINLIYTDPQQKDPAVTSATLRQQLSALQQRQDGLAPLAEAVLEMQVTQILHEQGLTSGGQPIPWVLYHTAPLPQNLVISPRTIIQQETSALLQPDLSLEQAIALEERVSRQLNVSAVVVDVGGLAAYPTMIMRTTALDWLTSTIAHEWIHLYLGQRPLGMNYDKTPELRSMNETTASIAGNEIGRIVLERYYPELAARYSLEYQTAAAGAGPVPPPQLRPAFNFRAEMHRTRVRADELLAAGQIEAAEAYMEQRRQVFWENGYAIRKINQAYFAFYGAYADTPGGAAGEDPVGPAVRQLRDQSASLKDFLERISRLDSFAALQKAVQ
jgi:hypothetical protein